MEIGVKVSAHYIGATVQCIPLAGERIGDRHKHHGHAIVKTRHMKNELSESVSLDTETRAIVYRSVIETSLDGFMRVDMQGRIIEINDALVRQTGYSRSELLQMRVPDLEANERETDFRAHAEHIARLGGDLFETLHRRKDGSTWQVEVNVTYAEVEGGCFFVFLRDIHQRKREEDMNRFRLELTEEAQTCTIDDLLQRTLDTAELWTASTIGFFHFVDTDQETLTLQTWSTNTLKKMCTAEGKGQHYPISQAGVWAEAVRQCQPVIINDYPAFPEKCGMPDGHAPVERVANVPILGPQGKIVAVLGVGNKPRPYEPEDIFVLATLGMQAMELVERRRNNDRLMMTQRVFEATQDSIMITDAKGDILAVNRAFNQSTGYTEAEVFGRNPRILNSGRHPKTFFERMFEAVLSRGYWQGEIVNRRKNGQEYTEWLTLNAVRDELGNLRNFVAVASDLTEKKAAEAREEYLAHYDQLTGLPNRTFFEIHLEQAVARSQRRGQSIALLLIDIDRFKNINESLGHPVGDVLLKEVSRRLQGRLRKEDLLARLGGDEFAVTIEELPRPNSAAIVAQQVIEAIGEVFLLGAHEIYIGASIGVSMLPTDANDAVGLLRNADSAVALAKAQGRGTYCFYTESLTEAARVRLELHAQLRHAIQLNQFEVHYQPQISLHDDKVVGIEALVRWRHEDGRLISPAVFIPVAEETGLIEALGGWVLRQACQQIKAWLDSGGAPLTLAVNVSPRQFHAEKLPQLVTDVLRDTGFPPELLELEITESAIMEHADEAIRILDALKALGVQLAIDDFGTGYSSLSYLKRFPVDKLKIDQSFVRDIPNDLDDMEIAGTIIAMARHMHLTVLAEGVETVAQRNFLHAQSCDHYQGYLFSKPVAYETLVALLAKG